MIYTIKKEYMMTYDDKLFAAIQYLGKKWVMHPDYNRKENPAHSMKFGSYILNKFSAKARRRGRI